MSLSSKKLGLSALSVFVLALAVAQGCSSSDDSSQAQPTAGTSSGGTTGKAGSSSGGATNGGTTGKAGSSSGGATNNGGTSGGGEAGTGTTVEGGAGGEGGATVDCDGPNGCYNCAPTNDTQFLNHCVAGGCQPAQDFKLPATLPALP